MVSCFGPLLLLGIYFQMKIVMSQDADGASSLADSSKVCNNSTAAMRHAQTKFKFYLTDCCRRNN